MSVWETWWVQALDLSRVRARSWQALNVRLREWIVSLQLLMSSMKVSEQKNIGRDDLGRLNSNGMQNREAVPPGSKQWGFIGILAELRLSPVMAEGVGDGGRAVRRATSKNTYVEEAGKGQDPDFRRRLYWSLFWIKRQWGLQQKGYRFAQALLC